MWFLQIGQLLVPVSIKINISEWSKHTMNDTPSPKTNSIPFLYRELLTSPFASTGAFSFCRHSESYKGSIVWWWALERREGRLRENMKKLRRFGILYFYLFYPFNITTIIIFYRSSYHKALSTLSFVICAMRWINLERISCVFRKRLRGSK